MCCVRACSPPCVRVSVQVKRYAQQLNELDALQQLQGPEGDGRSFLGKELISAMTTLQDRAGAPAVGDATPRTEANNLLAVSLACTLGCWPKG